MKIKPILFSTPMIKAIMEDRKTQTRRIVKTKEKLTSYEGCLDDASFWKEHFLGRHLWQTKDGEFQKKPKYEVGDVMWVRETFAELYDYEDHPELDFNMRNEWDCGFWYKTDGELKDAPLFVKENKWKPSIFMPKEACRNFLKVNKVRVERVQDISEDDALAEGVLFYDCDITKSRHFKDYLTKVEGYSHPDHDYPTVNSAYESFKTLWISINGQKSWDSNPYIWVYNFKKTEKPKNFMES